MQGGMLMPMISYQESLGKLQVMMPPETPELTPLLISNPNDTFDPLDPWFDTLDPGRQGQGFSRRYGFVMDAMTDDLPPDTAIWIRRLSGSPEVSAYRYSGSAPKAWEPIFGTCGTSNAMYWNGMMFHPAFAALPGTNVYTVTYEAYLVDTTTGSEIPNTGTGPMVFNWTTIPDGRPDVSMALRAVIGWSTSITNYAVEQATSLTTGDWTLVTNQPVVVDGQNAVLLETGQAGKVYRMRRLP